ncbi:hypothetical protein ATCVMN08101_976R [Acanthocystis turfacea Chlorella virus MN0810.1]|nr:hypothetical protein ATCVMN08101_976R [Acanthocystis turfacea Chlorella virus MN0810.1]
MAFNYTSRDLSRMTRDDLITVRKNLGHHIDYTLETIAELEYELHTHAPAGYGGPGYGGCNLRFNQLDAAERKYLEECYQLTWKSVQKLQELKKLVQKLRTQYTNVCDAIRINSYIKKGFIKPSASRAIVIEDSDKFDDSAFGPEIYVV